MSAPTKQAVTLTVYFTNIYLDTNYTELTLLVLECKSEKFKESIAPSGQKWTHDEKLKTLCIVLQLNPFNGSKFNISLTKFAK